MPDAVVATLTIIKNVDPLVWAYGILEAVLFVMTTLMIVGAWRNHFTFHRLRPIIWSLAAFMGSLWIFFATRVYGAYLRTSGQTAAYLAASTAWWWYATVYLITLSILALFFTLIFAYPGSQKAFK